MVYEQLANAATLLAKSQAGTREFLSDFLLPLLEQPIKFVLIDLSKDRVNSIEFISLDLV